MIILTGYLAALSEVDGGVLAKLLERSARSPTSTPRQRIQLKILAKAAKAVQAAKTKHTADNAQKIGEQVAKAIVQALDEKAADDDS